MSIDTLAPQLGVAPIEVTPDEMQYLKQYDWPGNVRDFDGHVGPAVVRSGEHRETADVV